MTCKITKKIKNLHITIQSFAIVGTLSHEFADTRHKTDGSAIIRQPTHFSILCLSVLWRCFQAICRHTLHGRFRFVRTHNVVAKQKIAQRKTNINRLHSLNTQIFVRLIDVIYQRRKVCFCSWMLRELLYVVCILHCQNIWCVLVLILQRYEHFGKSKQKSFSPKAKNPNRVSNSVRVEKLLLKKDCLVGLGGFLRFFYRISSSAPSCISKPDSIIKSLVSSIKCTLGPMITSPGGRAVVTLLPIIILPALI